MIYEICVDTVGGVRAAKAAGADRVELCADLMEGGITPSRGMIRRARTITGMALNVMIRPRGGDFLFDDDEFATMQSDIEAAKAEGADGVVIGLLTAAGEVDEARTRELILLARPLFVTFHRAFDMTLEPLRAIETLVGLGVDRVLTSGQERNVDRVVASAEPREIHLAAPEPIASGMRFRRPRVFMGGELRPPEYDRLGASAASIRSVIARASG